VVMALRIAGGARVRAKGGLRACEGGTQS
jgi:hypothetical protein